MSDHAYETNEAQIFRREMAEIERASLADRKEAAAAFLDAMKTDTDHIAEQIEWIFNGSYGYGAMQAAKRIARNKRGNRNAQLNQMVAALCWRCPAKMAAAMWKKLSSSEKSVLAEAIRGTYEGRRLND